MFFIRTKIWTMQLPLSGQLLQSSELLLYCFYNNLFIMGYFIKQKIGNRRATLYILHCGIFHTCKRWQYKNNYIDNE